jgi:signal recognition particle receptor subunit beta
MAVFNYSTRELTTKIVYYGPGLCGKTTNLQYIYDHLKEGVRGKMLSLATKSDRTLFFDFLPVDIGEIHGMKTKVQLYTVPGQVFYNETRRLVLRGADGVVFVADSQENMLEANLDSFRNLEENLAAHGLSLRDLPHVLQYNKRDLPNILPVDVLRKDLNRWNKPDFEAIAIQGVGVLETFREITKEVLKKLRK